LAVVVVQVEIAILARVVRAAVAQAQRVEQQQLEQPILAAEAVVVMVELVGPGVVEQLS
jgi:hypothetical protein